MSQKPQKRWKKRVKRDLNLVDETASLEEADNRDCRRVLVEAAKDLNNL